jgi:hypothetical protein
MSRCPSCGGIIGRDCFNPIECAQISTYESSNHTRELEAAKIEISGLNLLIAGLRDEIKKRDFMIEKGLGWEDMKNDISARPD